MLRELKINGVKHARASSMPSEVRAVSGKLEISVEDYGIGFDSSQVMCYTMRTETSVC
jgi:signal transduction histidine kinase